MRSITNEDLEIIVRNSNTIEEAAKFLNRTVLQTSRLLKSVIQKDTGKSYFDILYRKKFLISSKYEALPSDAAKIVTGEKTYSPAVLKKKLITYGLIEQKCDNCGFDNIRINDNTIPLKLVFKDGDKKNQAIENIELLCFNCCYLKNEPFTIRGNKKVYTSILSDLTAKEKSNKYTPSSSEVINRNNIDFIKLEVESQYDLTKAKPQIDYYDANGVNHIINCKIYPPIVDSFFTVDILNNFGRFFTYHKVNKIIYIGGYMGWIRKLNIKEKEVITNNGF